MTDRPDEVVGEGLDNPNYTSESAVREHIENVLTGMAKAGDDERREGELYKAIAAKPDLVSRLRFVNNKYNEILLAALQVMEEVDGITFDQEKFDGIEMLSPMVREATQYYDRIEGPQGSVDKAYQLIADKMRDVLHYETPADIGLVEEESQMDVPYFSLGNTEPLPDHLPEEIKTILREARTRAGYDDNGQPIGEQA